MRRRKALVGGAAFTALATPMSAGSEGLPNGFHVPPEEAPHQRTFMQWPVSRLVHPDPVFLDIAQQTIADIANTIVAFEPVTVLMAAEEASRARLKLSDAV